MEAAFLPSPFTERKPFEGEFSGRQLLQCVQISALTLNECLITKTMPSRENARRKTQREIEIEREREREIAAE